MTIFDLLFGANTRVVSIERPERHVRWPLSEAATERLLFALSYLVPALLGGFAGWLIGTGAFLALCGRGH